MIAPAESRIDELRLEFLFGKAVLTASNVELGPWVRMTEFRGEIPGRRFPFDLGSEPDRFRGTRSVATLVTAELDGARLRRSLAGATRKMPDLGDVSVELVQDEVRLTIELADDASLGCVFVIRFGLVPDLTGVAELRLVAFDYLVLGDPRVHPAQIAARVLPLLLASPELRPAVPALGARCEGDMVTVPAARLCLSEAFVRRGWKQPGAERLQWAGVSVGPGRATLTAAAPDPHSSMRRPDSMDSEPGRAALASLEARALARTAETALLSGKIMPAIAGFRDAIGRYGAHPFLTARLLHALLSSPEPVHAYEARELVETALRKTPDDPTALSALARLGIRDGDSESALNACRRLAESLGRAGRSEDRVEALLFASRVAARSSSEEAAIWVDRALRLAPRNPSVLRCRVKLARALGDADSYEDGLTRLLSIARSRSARARLHRELGRLARDRRADHEAARVHLQEAVRLAGNDADVLMELGRACAAAGRAVEAVRAYRGAAALAERERPEAAIVALSAAADTWENHLRDPANALVDIRRALAIDPGAAALHSARVRLAAAGRDDDLLLNAIEAALAAIDPDSREGQDALRLVLEIGADTDARRGQMAAADSKRKRLAKLGAGPTPIEPGGSADQPTVEVAPAPSVVESAAAAPRPRAESTGSTEGQPAPTLPVLLQQTQREREELAERLQDARRGDDPQALVAVLPDAAAAERDPVQRAALLSELGQLLYYELEEASRALQYLEEAQRLDGDGAGSDYGLLSALEAIYEETASAEGLLTVYRRKLAQAGGEDIRNVYRLLMASVLFEQLGRPAQAIALLDEVVEHDARNIPALRLRARIWAATGRRADAAEGLETLIEMPEVDPFERQELLRDLGRLEWQALDRLDRAAERFERLLAEIPGDTDCISSLKQIYGRAAEWDRYIDVLRRELGILAGSPTAFADLNAAVDADSERVPKSLRPTFGRILAEAAAIVGGPQGDGQRALHVLTSAAALAPGDVFIHEGLLEAGQACSDDGSMVRAAVVVIPQLLNPTARGELLKDARAAARRLGTEPALLAQLAAAGVEIDDVAREPEAGLNPDAEPDVDPAPQPAVDSAPTLSERQPTAPQATATGETTDKREAIADRATPVVASEAVRELAAATAPQPTRMARLDAIAKSGAFDEAISAIDAWLPGARRPPLRRELLLRKGRWLLDRGADARAAVLPLKGALILDPDSADTRLELLRASCRLGDVSQATDQLREYLDARGEEGPADGAELHRLRCAIDDLSAMPRGPVPAWISDLVNEVAPGVAAALATER